MEYVKNIPHIFWINLDRNIDRRIDMEKKFKKCNMQNTRIVAYDGYNDNLEQYCDFDNKVYDYLPGQLGCTLSHLKAILNFFKRTNLDTCIIMEDDVSFEFIPKWNASILDIINHAPNNWDIIQLSYTIDKFSRLEKKPFYIPWRIDHYGTVAYLINKKGALKILTKLLKNHKFYFGNNHRYITADYILYSIVKTYTYKLPYFTYNLNESNIKQQNEHLHLIAKKIQKRVWSQFREKHHKTININQQ
jgi:GR25 family glycosyltransferase involved in LPS biosynthesis